LKSNNKSYAPITLEDPPTVLFCRYVEMRLLVKKRYTGLPNTPAYYTCSVYVHVRGQLFLRYT